MKYYFYPAVFHFYEDDIVLVFPDLPDCLPRAHSLDAAIENAKETLKTYLERMKKEGHEFPEPSRIEDLRLDLNQNAILIETYLCTSDYKKQSV